MNYKKRIEQGIVSKINYFTVSSARDSDAALQAKLAYMEGDNHSVNKLLGLDGELKRIGLSEMVTTPQAVQIALNIRDYILNVARQEVRNASLLTRMRQSPRDLFEPKNVSNIEYIFGEEYRDISGRFSFLR